MSTYAKTVTATIINDDDVEYELRAKVTPGTAPTRTWECPMGYPGDPPEMDDVQFSIDGGKTWESMDIDHPLFEEAERALWSAS